MGINVFLLYWIFLILAILMLLSFFKKMCFSDNKLFEIMHFKTLSLASVSKS